MAAKKETPKEVPVEEVFTESNLHTDAEPLAPNDSVLPSPTWVEHEWEEKRGHWERFQSE